MLDFFIYWGAIVIQPLTFFILVFLFLMWKFWDVNESGFMLEKFGRNAVAGKAIIICLFGFFAFLFAYSQGRSNYAEMRIKQYENARSYGDKKRIEKLLEKRGFDFKELQKEYEFFTPWPEY